MLSTAWEAKTPFSKIPDKTTVDAYESFSWDPKYVKIGKKQSHRIAKSEFSGRYLKDGVTLHMTGAAQLAQEAPSDC
jgi:hypothetical protein